MAEYYLFASGGAGIKTAIAVVLLAAAGYTPFKNIEQQSGWLRRNNVTRDYNHSITIIPCDIDINSAQRERLEMLHKQQAYLRRVYNNGKMLEIKIDDSIRFSNDKADGITLNDMVGGHYDNPLVKSLFDPAQCQKTNIDGTEGDMQLGSFFASRFITDAALKTLFKDYPERDRYIAFSGSVYGGTGASVTPTAYRLVKNFFENHASGKMDTLFTGTNTQGCILMLPYFSISADPKNIAVESPEHTPRTKAALGKISQLRPDYTALVGAKQRTMKIGGGTDDKAIVAKGSRRQLNPLMPEDIVAAMAVFDFFTRIHQNEEVYVEATNSSLFTDLPDGQELAVCTKRLNYFLKMLKFYYVHNEKNNRTTSFSGFYNRTQTAANDENYLSIIGHHVYGGDDEYKNRNNLLNALQEVEWNCPGENQTTGSILGGFSDVDDFRDIADTRAGRQDRVAIERIYKAMHKFSAGNTDNFVGYLWEYTCRFFTNQ